MKRQVLLALSIFVITSATAYAEYDFGNYTSKVLTNKAWDALEFGDLDGVLAYTEKCISLYGQEADRMAASLADYAESGKEFDYWALNDVGTSYYLRGEAFRKEGITDRAKEAFQIVIDKYKYSQCWDPKGWFWKPAEAAAEKIEAIETGLDYDFGDYTSQTLTTKAWQALGQSDLYGVLAYTNKCANLYGKRAEEMQASLYDYPLSSDKATVHNYWALNDVGTCYFIQGEAYKKAGRYTEARMAYQTVIDKYGFSQCWDPQGWFWKPTDASRERITEIEKMGE